MPEISREEMIKFFITHSIKVTNDVLTTFCMLQAETLKPIVRPKAQKMTGITAIIGLISPEIIGTIAITFEKECYLKMVSNMFGETYTKISADIIDGSSEVLNQVFGHLKYQCNSKGIFFSMTIPSIIRGDEYQVIHKGSKDPFCIPFKTNFGGVLLEIVADFNL